MKFTTGHNITKDVRDIDGVRAVNVVAEDGRTLFEIRLGKDGRSIEVRGIDACRVGGVLYSSLLDLRLSVSNAITVRVREYDDNA